MPRLRTTFVKAALACTALVLVAGALYVYFWFYRPMGRGPAGPPVSNVVFQKAWRTNEVILLGFGDSVTAGFGASKGLSYFDRLIENPPDEFAEMRELSLHVVFPKLVATNLAISGSTSLQHIKVQASRLKPYGTNVTGIVVLTTGGNDIIHNYGKTPPREGAMYGATWEQAQPWIANFEKRLVTMLRNFEETFPGECHIFLANIYDPTDGLGDAHRAGLPKWPDGLRIHAAYNEVINRVAAKFTSVHVVDMHKAFLGHGIHCRQFWRDVYRREDPYYWYHINLEDPNDRGYDALRRLFLNEMVHVFAH